jgi:hypothetical protein
MDATPEKKMTIADIVKALIELDEIKQAFVTALGLPDESDIRQMVDDALDSYEPENASGFDSGVENVIENYDFADKINDVVKEEVEDAVERKIKDAKDELTETIIFEIAERLRK